MRDFRKLEVWHQSMELVDKIYQLCTRFPISEQYGLIQQIQKSAVSIPSNIAEGNSRDSEKEYSRFLQISLGSAFELETQLLISQKRKYISDEPELFELLLIVQKRLNALNQSIKRPSKSKTNLDSFRDQRPKTKDQRLKTKD